ncbi:MAG: methionyl-tRNA formyltransferase [Firmicutes bacterium]|nr:methionyl-tRNA formyltransferase [Bacillota bacterium]
MAIVNMRECRVVFMGTPDFAATILQALLAAHWQIVAVVTQPDRPVGRKRVLTSSPVKELALAHGIKVLQPSRLRHADALAELAACTPDVIVTAAYGQILSEAALALPGLGAYNVHASLLPAYRGAAPIQWAIRRGETVTGVSLMTMVKAMDAGPVWDTATVPIAPEATYKEVHDLLATAGARLTLEGLPRVLSGDLQPQEQDPARVTFAPPITRADERLDWQQSARQIVDQIRSLAPQPGAFTTMEGQVLKLYRASVIDISRDTQQAVPGQVMSIHADGPIVYCGDGLSVLVHELQPSGRSVQSGREFVRGRPKLTGVILGEGDPL